MRPLIHVSPFSACRETEPFFLPRDYILRDALHRHCADCDLREPARCLKASGDPSPRTPALAAIRIGSGLHFPAGFAERAAADVRLSGRCGAQSSRAGRGACAVDAGGGGGDDGDADDGEGGG